MMDSFELTKFAAAGLLALLLIVFPKTMIDMAKMGHSEEVVGGYKLPEPVAAEAGKEGEAPAAAAFDPAAVVALVKTAKPENAAGTFKKCLGCHSADATSPSKAGPNLWGIVGRKPGAASDFKGYSDAMKSKGGEWTFESLAGFIHGPKAYLPGTKMAFSGVTDPQELADLLAHLRTLADSPVALP